ncbi:MAG: site-2 protease family protein [Deltaproteobacteria bacterium]|jgi:Zn-dependent protease|nr:site-2 protease family protein [Deltaproteobacteria bacterium]
MFDFDAETFRQTLLLIPPLLFALTVHELSHGWTAWKLGDPTAKERGRITLNPIAHLDLVGTLCILLTHFIGWAKPVPVDPRHFRNPVRGMAIVAAAGPASNFLMAAASGFLLNKALSTGLLDALPRSVGEPLAMMAFIFFSLNLGLGLFNLLPFPPLDGFRVISVALPLKAVRFCERYSFVFFVALLALMWSKVLTGPISSVIGRLQQLVLP